MVGISPFKLSNSNLFLQTVQYSTRFTRNILLLSDFFINSLTWNWYAVEHCTISYKCLIYLKSDKSIEVKYLCGGDTHLLKRWSDVLCLAIETLSSWQANRLLSPTCKRDPLLLQSRWWLILVWRTPRHKARRSLSTTTFCWCCDPPPIANDAAGVNCCHSFLWHSFVQHTGRRDCFTYSHDLWWIGICVVDEAHTTG